MANYYQNDRILNIEGYEVYFTRFSDSIINDHFQEALSELKSILESFYITDAQVIQGGGGKSSITQSLASLLDFHDWSKKIIESKFQVEERILSSESHEVDHYKTFERGNIGLEIEWNNKDPFYDRDLENFRKLHQIGELAMGMINTRGKSLQLELLNVFKRFLTSKHPFTVTELLKVLGLSDKAKQYIESIIALPKGESIQKISNMLYNSKFGAATTHMDKLLLRINRGVGNPCPFVLIGIGKERLINP